VDQHFWLTAGLGGGYFSDSSQESTEGIALVGQLSYLRGVHLWSLRGSVVAEVLGDGIADLGVLYGRRSEGPQSHVSASAGLGLVYYEDCPGGLGTGGCRSATSLGIPFALTASWRPAPVVGFGVQALGNLNGSHSFIAGLFILELGNLR